MIMMCQFRCIGYNKWTTLVEEIDKVGAESVWGWGYMGNLCTFLLVLF